MTCKNDLHIHRRQSTVDSRQSTVEVFSECTLQGLLISLCIRARTHTQSPTHQIYDNVEFIKYMVMFKPSDCDVMQLWFCQLLSRAHKIIEMEQNNKKEWRREKKQRNEASDNSFSGSTLAKSTTTTTATAAAAATSHPPESSRKSKSNMKYWEEAESLHPVDFSKNILHTAAAASIFVWHITSQIVGCCAAAIALPWCYSPIFRLSLSRAHSDLHTNTHTLSILLLLRFHAVGPLSVAPSCRSDSRLCFLSLALRQQAASEFSVCAIKFHQLILNSKRFYLDCRVRHTSTMLTCCLVSETHLFHGPTTESEQNDTLSI